MFERFALHPFCRHTRVSEFVAGLEEGRLLASVCTDCGHRSFPPRSDCKHCRSSSFEFVEIGGLGSVCSHTAIHAAPSGFESYGAFVLAVVDLDEGGRVLAPLRDFDHPLAIGERVCVRPEVLNFDGGSRATYFIHPNPPDSVSDERSP